MTNEMTTTNQVPFVNKDALDIIKEVFTSSAGLNFKMERVKFGKGGSTMFELPGDEGDNEIVKNIDCVITYHHPANTYYASKFTGGHNPPECSSFDGTVGVGTPGGFCKDCAFSKFGSGEGNSKACKNRQMLYILRSGEYLPMIMNLPTGSLDSFSKYIVRLMSKGKTVSNVVTQIGLKTATTDKGLGYSQATFKFVRDLTPNEREVIGAMRDSVQNYVSATVPTALIDEDENPFIEASEG